MIVRCVSAETWPSQIVVQNQYQISLQITVGCEKGGCSNHALRFYHNFVNLSLFHTAIDTVWVYSKVVNQMELIDTHCHLNFDRFDGDRADMIARAKAAGVTRMIVPATDMANCETILAMTEQFEGLFAAVGVHPNSTADFSNGDLSKLYDLAAHPNVVAIGEIGVDYHWDKSPKLKQHAAFGAQLEVAAFLNLPVIIHNRKASEDTIALMAASELVGRDNAGVMHSFSAEYETAKQALDLGFYLGFTGPVTYKNAQSLREIVAKVPLDRILIETDAPFLSPQSKRGKRNEPAYVVQIADRIAAIHNKSLEEIAEITTANAVQLFGLS